MPENTSARPARYVGARVNRSEDPKYLRGLGSYVDDIRLKGMLHAVFVRSPYAHARILSIDTKEAEAVPGVVCVKTGADLEDRIGKMATIAMAREVTAPKRAVLAVDRARYVGDAVAVGRRRLALHGRGWRGRGRGRLGAPPRRDRPREGAGAGRSPDPRERRGQQPRAHRGRGGRRRRRLRSRGPRLLEALPHRAHPGRPDRAARGPRQLRRHERKDDRLVLYPAPPHDAQPDRTADQGAAQQARGHRTRRRRRLRL